MPRDEDVNDPNLTCRDSDYGDLQPCVGCGYCCKQAPCGLCLRLYGLHTADSGCPVLRHEDGRYWCGAISDAGGDMKKRLVEDLAIGDGCCSPLFNTDRDTQLKRMGAGTGSPTARLGIVSGPPSSSDK